MAFSLLFEASDSHRAFATRAMLLLLSLTVAGCEVSETAPETTIPQKDETQANPAIDTPSKTPVESPTIRETPGGLAADSSEKKRGIGVRELIVEQKTLEWESLVLKGPSTPVAKTLSPKDVKQKPKPGNKLVVIDIDVTTRKPGVKIVPTRFKLLRQNGDTIPLWGTYGPLFPGGPAVALSVKENVMVTTLKSAGANFKVGLVFMLPNKLNELNMRLVWGAKSQGSRKAPSGANKRRVPPNRKSSSRPTNRR